MFNLKSFNPRRNVYDKWTLTGLVSLLLASLSIVIPLVGVPIAIFFYIAFVQFMHASAKKMSPGDEPYLVRHLENLENWWDKFSKPLQPTFHGGQRVYTRGYYDFREIFDLHGRMIGVDQTTEWSASDMDWQPGDPEETVVKFTPVSKIKNPRKASWFAMIRSPKHSVQVSNIHPISAMLNGRRDGHVTLLTMRAA